jgi:hypothetical protein
MIKLGDSVRDKVTGFEGIALARMEALYEATQLRVHPSTVNTSGEIRTSVWIEEERLATIKAAEHPNAGFGKPEVKA